MRSCRQEWYHVSLLDPARHAAACPRNDLDRGAALQFGPTSPGSSTTELASVSLSPDSACLRASHLHPRRGATSVNTASITCALYSTPSWLGTVSSKVSASATASS